MVVLQVAVLQYVTLNHFIYFRSVDYIGNFA